MGENPQTVGHRPADLAREHGISPQTVRNYERDGVIPPAERTATGYRRYTPLHAAALRAYLALVAAHGYAAAGEIMRAAEAGERDHALRVIDHGHAQLLRDRETVEAVEAAAHALVRTAPAPRSQRIGALAHRLGVKPATLRKWERAGILSPGRDPATHQRVYHGDDIRDAELTHLLRRGGYLLAHIAGVVAQVRGAGGPEPLAESLHAWRARNAARARAMLFAAGRLEAYLHMLDAR